MALEKYIIGKHDSGRHDGRYANIKRELVAEVDEDIGEQLAISLSALRVLPKDSDLYRYHRSICDFWLDKENISE